MSPYIAAPWILWDLYSSETANPMSFPHVLWISLCSCTLLHWSPIHFLGLKHFETTDEPIQKPQGSCCSKTTHQKYHPPKSHGKKWMVSYGFVMFHTKFIGSMAKWPSGWSIDPWFPGWRSLGRRTHGADAGAGACAASACRGAGRVQAQQQPETLGEQVGKKVHGGCLSWLYIFLQFVQKFNYNNIN